MNNTEHVTGFEKIKRVTEGAVEYWVARELMPLLGYASWDKFEGVIERAMNAAANAPKGVAIVVGNHFSRTGKMVAIGSGAQRQKSDFYLTRYACYLIAMNADPTKPEVGHAMTYFAAQTRRQEISDKLIDTEKRLEVRLRVMENNRQLAGAAKAAGVVRYPIFQDAGNRGLYGGMGTAEVKAHKKVPASEDLLDNIGRLELSAHEFRASVTEDRLNREGVSTERRAIETHRAVGEEVRQIIVKENGVRPENLPTEPSIKRLVQKHRRTVRAAKADKDTPLLP